MSISKEQMIDVAVSKMETCMALLGKEDGAHDFAKHAVEISSRFSEMFGERIEDVNEHFDDMVSIAIANGVDV